MCTMSMVMDHYADKWTQPPYTYPGIVTTYPSYPGGSSVGGIGGTSSPNQTPPIAWSKLLQPQLPTVPKPKPITSEEIEEFRTLLERAREYDRKNNEPDCELQEKKQKILDLAAEHGLKIEFL